jgi:RND family efflux transporter MFP subunit
MRSTGEPALVAASLHLLLGALFVLASCGNRTASENHDSEPQVLVSAANVALVESRRLESGVSFTGELLPSETVEVVARFDGDLESMLVREGQRVHRGQKLAVYKAREVQGALEAAQADVQAAQAGLVAMESAVRRAKRLVEAGAAAPADFETAEAQYKAAEARVRAAQAKLNVAEENAASLDVPSPIDGIVSKTYVHSGDRTAVGDRLLQVVDTSVLELSATVPSEMLSFVQPGMPIEFHVDAYPGETFTGHVDRLNPTTEAGTRQVRIYTRLSNPEDRLVGGLFASGRLIRATKENATTAPLGCLRLEGSEQVVYRVHDGIAQRIAVQTGLVDDEAGVVETVGAVAPGDSLLMGVLPGLRPDVRVRILSGTTANGKSVSAEATEAPDATSGAEN